ncbi:MAG TPA: cytochrome P450 [Gammaproteobacteria bacterium]
MTVSQLNNSIVPPGPSTPHDITVSEQDFQRLGEWLTAYGDIFQVPQVSRKGAMLVINHPEAIKHVLVTNSKNYAKGVGFELVKMLLGNGIIVSDGATWWRQRRMIQPAFNKKVIAQLTQQMKQINLRLLEKWRALAEQQAVIDITEATNTLALEIILRALFSDDFDAICETSGDNPFAILTDDSARDLKLVVKYRALTKLVGELIAQRRTRAEQPLDWLSLFIDARDKESGEPMSDKEMIDEIMTMIVAGSETSATTMNWTWYRLSQHPAVEQKVHAAVDHASYDLIPGFEHLAELGYIHQVVEEVLRLYPPVWLFTRKTLEDDTIAGYRVAAGTDIAISPYYIHRHAVFWENPEAFDPNRFAPEQEKKRNKYAYIPFSAGPRRCIGDFFAIVEAQIHFGLMTRHFTLQHVADNPVELQPGVNLRTKHAIHMRIKPRKSANT